MNQQNLSVKKMQDYQETDNNTTLHQKNEQNKDGNQINDHQTNSDPIHFDPGDTEQIQLDAGQPVDPSFKVSKMYGNDIESLKIKLQEALQQIILKDGQILDKNNEIARLKEELTQQKRKNHPEIMSKSDKDYNKQNIRGQTIREINACEEKYQSNQQSQKQAKIQELQKKIKIYEIRMRMMELKHQMHIQSMRSENFSKMQISRIEHLDKMRQIENISFRDRNHRHEAQGIKYSKKEHSQEETQKEENTQEEIKELKEQSELENERKIIECKKQEKQAYKSKQSQNEEEINGFLYQLANQENKEGDENACQDTIYELKKEVQKLKSIIEDLNQDKQRLVAQKDQKEQQIITLRHQISSSHKQKQTELINQTSRAQLQRLQQEKEQLKKSNEKYQESFELVLQIYELYNAPNKISEQNKQEQMIELLKRIYFEVMTSITNETELMEWLHQSKNQFDQNNQYAKRKLISDILEMKERQRQERLKQLSQQQQMDISEEKKKQKNNNKKRQKKPLKYKEKIIDPNSSQLIKYSKGTTALIDERDEQMNNDRIQEQMNNELNSRKANRMEEEPIIQANQLFPQFQMKINISKQEMTEKVSTLFAIYNQQIEEKQMKSRLLAKTDKKLDEIMFLFEADQCIKDVVMFCQLWNETHFCMYIRQFPKRQNNVAAPCVFFRLENSSKYYPEDLFNSRNAVTVKLDKDNRFSFGSGYQLWIDNSLKLTYQGNEKNKYFNFPNNHEIFGALLHSAFMKIRKLEFHQMYAE